jgi:hypothetical protein
MRNFRRDDCGPVWMLVGNGGTNERMPKTNADDSEEVCASIFGKFEGGTVEPSICSKKNITYQAAYSVGGQPGYVPNPLNGSEFFCQSSQPLWSAYRGMVYGFASLTFESATQARWQFFPNDLQTPGGPVTRATDTATYTRARGACPNKRLA